MRAQPAPGDDFFAYANHEWLARTTIPAGRTRWTVRDDIDSTTRRQLATLLADAAHARAGSLARTVADFHAAFLDSARIERRGIRPLALAFERIGLLHDRHDLARLLGASMRADVDPLGFGVYASATPLGVAVQHSIHGERRYTAFLVQGGLALGDREAYLSTDSAAVERRARYRAYLARMLMLARFGDAERRADSVLAIETALARTHATAAQSGIDRNADSVWSRAAFPRLAPGMDWSAFLAAATLDDEASIAVWQPSAVRGLASVVASHSIAAWKDYLRFHALHDAADALPYAFGDARAAMLDDHRSREERATAAMNAQLGDAIGRLYAARFFSAGDKARVRRVVASVAAAFRARVANAAWLSPASRRVALGKLDALYLGVGYPETWPSWPDLVVDPRDAYGNVQRADAHARRMTLARLAGSYDPHEWVMPAHSVGAVLIFQQNAYTFAAGLLQAPKYDHAFSDAAAYGAIGAIFGHDISHFVDVLGAEYQANGAMRRWWTPDDAARFDAAAEPLVRQVSTCEPVPGAYVDGRLTRTENVADLAGLSAAFNAYRASLGTRARDSALVRRSDREFFVAFARAFGAKATEAGLRAQLAGDHAPESCRMSTVRNLDAWYAAFDVTPSQRLYLAPAERVRVW